MTFFQSIILGVVEGITEFLPISSTAHLVLTSELLGIPTSDFLKTFEVAIQLGAILAIVVLYWRRLLENRRLVAKVLLAWLPTAVVGFVLYSLVRSWLGTTSIVLTMMFLGGLALILFELFLRHRNLERDVSYSRAFLIGVSQALAVIPGVSRSAATIVPGLLMGVSRRAIVEFSFLLAIPTVLSATGYDLLKNYHAFTLHQFGLLAVGFVVAFAVALPTVRWFLRFVERRTFIIFGVYRIILAIGLIWLLSRPVP